MTLFGGVLLYLGLLGAAAGLISLVKPLTLIGVATRGTGLLVLGIACLTFAAGVYLPAAQTRVDAVRTRLDEFAPVFQFSESHSIPVRASKDRVYSAIRKVCPEEIRFLDTLMRIRFLTPPPKHRPILETFIAGGFVTLADDPGREIVFGRAGDGRTTRRLTPDEFKAFHPVPLIKIAMNFRIREMDATHCLLTTETRVYADGPQTLHGFAAYWRMIQPGSALIRSMWLRAIRQRAESASDTARLR